MTAPENSGYEMDPFLQQIFISRRPCMPTFVLGTGDVRVNTPRHGLSSQEAWGLTYPLMFTANLFTFFPPNLQQNPHCLLMLWRWTWGRRWREIESCSWVGMRQSQRHFQKATRSLQALVGQPGLFRHPASASPFWWSRSTSICFWILLLPRCRVFMGLPVKCFCLNS